MPESSAAANVNRYNGWTSRPYSILEHSVIGAKIAIRKGCSPKPFLLHDMEETEFTDMITPHKVKYMNAKYHVDVAKWNAALCKECGLSPSALSSPMVKLVDAIMLAAETRSVTAKGWVAPMVSPFDVAFAKDAIHSGEYRDAESFWRMWG